VARAMTRARSEQRKRAGDIGNAGERRASLQSGDSQVRANPRAGRAR
jgi:hypothetical protein